MRGPLGSADILALPSRLMAVDGLAMVWLCELAFAFSAMVEAASARH